MQPNNQINYDFDRNEDEKTVNIRRKLRIILEEWGVYTTAHGVGSILRTNSIIVKVIWLFCLLVCVACCTYLIIKTLIMYSNYEVLTTSTIINEAPALFPAVTICNLNAFKNINSQDISNILSNINKTIPIDYVDKATDALRTYNAVRKFKKKTDTFPLFVLEDMLISCKYQSIDCNRENFTVFYDFNYGSCYTFNGDQSQIKKSVRSGPINGLRLELYIGDNTIEQQFTYSSGFRVLIHNQKANNLFTDEEGLDVSVGYQTNIAVSKTIITRLPEPYSQCFNSEYSSKNLEKHPFINILRQNYNVSDYAINFCIKACFQELIIEKCGCFDLKLPLKMREGSYVMSLEPCDIDKTNCTSQLASSIEDCYSKCPNECEQTIFDSRINTAKYPSVWYAKLVANNNNSKVSLKDKSLDYLERTTLMVNIYYDEMYYTSVEESEAMNFESLFSAVGGYFGLFIGMSILTFVEIIENTFHIAYYLILRFNENNKKQR